MKAVIRTFDDHGMEYSALMFCCPGCAELDENDGIHMVPVNTIVTSPSWDWDGNLDNPTLSPSILTGKNDPLFVTLLTVFLVVGWPILFILICGVMVYWIIGKVKQ